MLGAVLVSNSSYATWTILGNATLQRLDQSNLSLTCLPNNNSICYTDDHVTLDIYMPDGSHIFCHPPQKDRTLEPVPGTAGQYIQVGTIVVEPMDISQQW